MSAGSEREVKTAPKRHGGGGDAQQVGQVVEAVESGVKQRGALLLV